MACQTIYAEMMSLQLDGLLGAEDERQLLAHIGSCAECTALWGPMNEVHAVLVASALEPLAPSPDFSLKVMERVAVSQVVRPQLDIASQPATIDARPGHRLCPASAWRATSSAPKERSTVSRSRCTIFLARALRPLPTGRSCSIRWGALCSGS